MSFMRVCRQLVIRMKTFGRQLMDWVYKLRHHVLQSRTLPHLNPKIEKKNIIRVWRRCWSQVKCLPSCTGRHLSHVHAHTDTQTAVWQYQLNYMNNITVNALCSKWSSLFYISVDCCVCLGIHTAVYPGPVCCNRTASYTSLGRCLHSAPALRHFRWRHGLRWRHQVSTARAPDSVLAVPVHTCGPHQPNR
jgi:hypothetical protein